MKITINNGGHFYSGQGGCLTRLVVLSIAIMIGALLLPGINGGDINTPLSPGTVLLTALVISILNTP